MWLPSWLQEDLAPTPGRWQSALRFAICSCVVVAIGQILRLPNYYWGLITICVLVLPTAGAVLAKSLFRMVGTSIAGVLSVWMVSGFIQNHIFFTLFLFGINLVLFYYATGKSAPYAFLICSMTITIITFSVVDAPYQVEWEAPTRAFEVCVGIFVVSFFTLTLWPHFARDELRERYSFSIRTVANLHECVWRHLLAVTPGRQEYEAILVNARGGLANRAALLEDSVWEDPGMEIRRPYIERQNYHLSRLYSLLYQTTTFLDDPPRESLYLAIQEEATTLVDAIVSELRQLADDVDARRLGEVPEGLLAAAEAVQARLGTPEIKTQGMKFSTGNNMHSLTYLAGLMEAAEVLITLRKEYQTQRRTFKGTLLLPIRRIFSGLWAETIKLEPKQLRKAIAAATAIAFIFIVGQSGYLGSSSLAAIAASLVISWPTVGGGISKGIFCVLATLLGSFAAFLMSGLVLPYTNSLGSLMVGCAPFFVSAGYLLSGPPRIAFIGMFTGVMFASNAFQGFAPPAEITGYSNTIIGMLAGSLIGIAVQLCFLSESAHRKVLASMAQFLRSQRDRLGRLHRLRDLPPPPDPHTAMSETQRDINMVNGMAAANEEARFEMEPHAIAKEHLVTVQAEFEQLLLATVSFESLSYQEMDTPALGAVKQPAIALKTHCLETLDQLARYSAYAGRHAYPTAYLERMEELREEVRDALHTVRAQCREHHIGQRPFVNAVSYLEHILELATLLERTAQALQACFPHQATSPATPEPTPAA